MDVGAVQVHRCSLPQLPLDRTIPRHVLAHRRGAISFSSGSSLFEGLPRLEVSTMVCGLSTSSN